MQATEKIQEITNPESVEPKAEAAEGERKKHGFFPAGVQIVLCLIFWAAVAVLYFFMPDMFAKLSDEYKTQINAPLLVNEEASAGVKVIEESN